MAAKPLPPQEVLLQLLRYDPKTGKLYWRERLPSEFVDGDMSAISVAKSWNTKHSGREALTACTGLGYRHGTIFDAKYLAHRVIWKMIYGVDPDYIDHVNGVTTDNRIQNLRSVTHKENLRNTSMLKNNTSGHMGVSFDAARKRWKAFIKVDGRMIHLGRFVSKDEAIENRKEAERQHGFHQNHGRAE